VKPAQLSGFFKRGSTWRFHIARSFGGVPIDITGGTVRAMFRLAAEDGALILTMDSSNGLMIPTGTDGLMQFSLSPVQTVLFPPSTKVYFDVELTMTDTTVWQSPTYYIVADKEVTHDD